MKDFMLFVLGVCLGLVSFIVINLPAAPTSFEKKICTIKLNDANKQTSYITGECVE